MERRVGSAPAWLWLLIAVFVAAVMLAGRTAAAAAAERKPIGWPAALTLLGEDEDSMGPCCRCQLNGECAAGYSGCGDDEDRCYCCLQGRECRMDPSGDLATTTCVRLEKA